MARPDLEARACGRCGAPAACSCEVVGCEAALCRPCRWRAFIFETRQWVDLCSYHATVQEWPAEWVGQVVAFQSLTGGRGGGAGA